MKKIILLVLIILSVTYTHAQEKKDLIVTAPELKEWITYLASDEMKGRANGSPEMKTAADWIARKIQRRWS